MKFIKKVGVSILVAFCVAGVTGSAFGAGNDSWTSSKRHYSVYMTGEVTTNTFHGAPLNVDRLVKATAVVVDVTKYQGPHDEEFQVCYTAPYGTSPIACTPWSDYGVANTSIKSMNVINRFYTNSGTGGQYTNILAKGDITIVHKLFDLDSPIYSDPGYDTVTVSY